tara:strand:- start:1494 stop:1718 length:225 start_codon:yes stop_codon:yes gene_type:complete
MKKFNKINPTETNELKEFVRLFGDCTNEINKKKKGLKHDIKYYKCKSVNGKITECETDDKDIIKWLSSKGLTPD